MQMNGGLKEAYLKFSRHKELWCVQSHQGVNTHKDQDGQDDGKVTDQLPHLSQGGEAYVSMAYVYVTYQMVSLNNIGTYHMVSLNDINA